MSLDLKNIGLSLGRSSNSYLPLMQRFVLEYSQSACLKRIPRYTVNTAPKNLFLLSSGVYLSISGNNLRCKGETSSAKCGVLSAECGVVAPAVVSANNGLGCRRKRGRGRAGEPLTFSPFYIG